MDTNVVLDYALFQMSTAQNRFNAIACCGGKSEQVCSGVLDQLLLCVPEASRAVSDSNNSFKLQLDERSRNRAASWFTKPTLKMFLNFTGAPEALKKMKSIRTELNQLEETRKFHLSLYTKDKLATVEGSSTDNEGLKQVESTQKVKVETVSSEVTKNELLRALELRLTALDKELVGIFMQTLGVDHSKDGISNLVAFAERFGSDDLWHSLQRYLTYQYEGLPANHSKEQSDLPHHSRDSVESLTEDSSSMIMEDSQKTFRNCISPAKIAEAERRSPTESEDSSDSSDGEHSTQERSRPVIRSASPRRSASPMRRVQIGRSGYRRPAALTIKSLGFIPAREKPLFSRDGDSEEESSEPKPKPSESSVVRMSVQDRINLFENKQRDQTVDNQKVTKGIEAPFGLKKSVLRRWSSGLGDASAHLQSEITPDERSENTAETIAHTNQNSTDDDPLISSNSVNNSTSAPLEKETAPSSVIDGSTSSVASQAEEMPDKAAASAEWTRQKEAELNEMLMKMMGDKPSIISTDGSGGVLEPSLERKGDFYSQYREKRDEKLRTENFKKKAEKEAKFKVMQETLEQRRAEMAKKVSASGKPNLSVQSQKPRRNSSPPVLSKKDSPTPTGPRKASPRTPSSLPTTRKSLPSAPTTRTVATPPKSSTGIVRSTVPNRRKPQSTPSPTNPTPRTEKPRQLKATKVTPPEAKSSLKTQEAKRPKEVTKSTKVIRKEPVTAVDKSATTPTKPSFYNKVTRKNSVVPLESKTSVKKAIGTNSGVAPVTPKTKTPQSKDSSKNCATPVQVEPKQLIVEAVEQAPSENNATSCNAADSNLDESSTSVLSEKIEADDDPETAEVVDDKNLIVNFPVAEIEPVEDLSISSAAWVEAEHQELVDSSNSNLPDVVNPVDDVSDTFSNSRVRHSLSQMLLADNGEPEIVEWGNAENPPSLVYQKDAPKGFKRLLKFARKNKADSNSTGWSSPSAFSDGDEEAQESKNLNKKSTDVLSKKTAIKTKASGKQRNMLAESYDCGNQRLSDLSAKHEILSTSMNGFPSAYKSREGNVSSSNASSKATRSFFSFSNFRGK